MGLDKGVITHNRQLGVLWFLTGSDIEEYAHRLEQSKTLAEKIVSSPFIRKDTETIYRERWIAAVGFCLPVTQFTDKQYAKIQSPFLNAIMLEMRFNRHFPRAVIFGPKKY